MQISDYADSKTYFTLLDEIDDPGICPIRARLFGIKIFLEFLLTFPIGFAYKAGKTCGRALSLFFSGTLLLITLGISSSIREFFISRVSSFARDLADWVLLPFAVLSYVVRLLIATVISPSRFLKF